MHDVGYDGPVFCFNFSFTTAEPVRESCVSAVFYVTSINTVSRLELTKKSIASEFRGLYVCLGVINKEKVLVLSVSLDPFSELRRSNKSQITFGFEKARFVS